MPTSQDSYSTASILAVVALYQCELSESQTVSSLLQILIENPGWSGHFSLILYDNSPQSQRFALPEVLSTRYVHDPSNRGLASAYNCALASAESEGCEWLLLLDQDTSLTADFISELLDATSTLRTSAAVGAIVPKLMVDGIMHSPSIPFLTLMRRQFESLKEPISRDFVGVLQQPMSSYNSGSTLRVSAVRSIGGFPSEFWLDFLDHAVFNSLISDGYQTYVLGAKLVHESSYSDLGSMPKWRLHNVLMAQTLFVKKSGNFIDRLLYRIYLLRHSRTIRRACKDPQMWRETALLALTLRVPKEPRLS